MKTEMLVECLDLTKNFSGKKALDAVNYYGGTEDNENSCPFQAGASAQGYL